MQHFESCAAKIQNRLMEVIEGEGVLAEGMRYAVDGGKRVRPILLLKTYEMLANKPALPVLDYACALEMIHAYSLVHDDLPCMDDDLERRGKPSVYGAFGEGNALLIGDALLTKAFDLIAGSMKEEKDLDMLINKALAMHELSRNAGYQGMIEGQILDVDGALMTQEDVEHMVSLKTAALLAAATGAGARLAGASEEQYRNVIAFAKHLGLAFQAKDDMFDREKDERDEKKTLIESFDDDEAQAYVDLHTEKAIASIAGFEGNEELVQLANLLVHRKY